jgi:hypothetical protein
MLSTFVVHLCIFRCLNSSGPTLFVRLRERGFRFCVCHRRCASGRVYDDDLYETICQIRGVELDGAGTRELVRPIYGTVTPDAQPLGSFTRRKLKQRLWRTLPCPTWRHGVAFTLLLHHQAVWDSRASLRPNVCLVHRSTMHAFVLCFVYCNENRRDGLRLLNFA